MGRGTLKHLLLPFSQFWEKGLGDEGHGTLGSNDPTPLATDALIVHDLTSF